MTFTLLKKKSVSSTNTYLKKLASAGIADQTVVIADTQTAGRGRWHRSWFSTPGSLCFSILFRNIATFEALHLQFICAVAVVQIFSQYFPAIKFLLKWPNDIIVDDKKLGGILVEKSNDYAVVGIGLNINLQSFPQYIDPPPTSLLLLTGEKQDRYRLFNSILLQIETIQKHYKKHGFFSIIRLYKKYWRDYKKPIVFKVNDQILRGTGYAIDTQGRIRIKKGKKIIHIDQGENQFVAEKLK